MSNKNNQLPANKADAQSASFETLLGEIKRNTDQHHLQKNFTHLIKKIFHDDLTMVQDYGSLLLQEVMKLYPEKDGVWRLKKDLLRFDEEHCKKLHVYKKTPAPSQTPRQAKKGPLKILLVSGMFPCTDHGGGLRLFDIASELCKDHQVDIFAIYNQKLEQNSYELLKDGFRRIKLIQEKEMSFENLHNWLNEENQSFTDYDFIQFEYPHSIPLIPQVKKYGVPTGYTFMECQTKSFAIYLYNMIKENRFNEFDKYVKIFWTYLTAEKKAVDNADHLITVTRGDAKAVEELGPVKTHIVPTSISNHAVINEIERHKDLVYEENSVAFLGYYGHYPNIDGMKWYLNEIHPIVKEKITDYKIYVIGRGDTSSLEKISAGDQNVIYTGRVNSIIPPILKAKVCILPLINGAGIRGKINQYSIAGRPSVTTCIGNHGLKYVNEESTMLADEPRKFANDIIRLLTDDQLYEKIRGNAKKVAEENYTWKNHIAKLVDIYRG